MFKNINTLDLTPFRLHTENVTIDNFVTILIPKFKNKFAKTFLSQRLSSSVFKVNLDKASSVVWQLIDGVRNVSQIIMEAESTLAEEIAPADERVSKFIFQLYDKNLISFKEINE